MAATIATDQFLTWLNRSGLVSREAAETAIWRLNLREEQDAVRVAKAMIHEGMLTRFQAECVLRGKTRGLTIDGYQLLYPLGAGGMGCVYAAVEVDTGWQVAIKVVSGERRDDEGMMTRFQLEAQAGMRLAHPNILRTLAINSTEDTFGKIHYVVMELVKAINLRELLDIRKHISHGQAIDIILQAAAGLHAAHQAGLVHRDVKPENILVRSDGSVKVLDFGLAMLDDNDEEFLMAVIFGQDKVGTADFVAPEQSINSYTVDARADIYSLGATLYFALTAKVPFPTRSVVEKIRGHRTAKPKPVLELRPDLPPRVAKILAKMMAKRPENRFETCEELIAYLKPFAVRSPVEFDFEQVVRARRKAAARRAKRKQSKASGAKSRSNMIPSISAPPQSVVDTVIRDETDLERDKGSADD